MSADRSARVLMVQGCTSDAGKSALVTALCRWAHRRGLRVAPFKPQNMALNSAVTINGGEIGRAQAVQAQAAGVAAHTDFNPVLLKPNTDTGAQVIVHGKAVGNMDAVGYHAYKRIAMDAVLASHRRLVRTHDVLLVEGAGSPAEINLRARDIANMGYAEAVDCPVLLIADIDRGGVFAHLVGTLALLSDSERARVAGFVINRFRGDIALLQPGLDWLEQHTGKPVIGVLPYLHGLHLEAEDALPRTVSPKLDARLRVCIPALPRISNHTDFDPLRVHPQVDLRYIGAGQAVPPCELIVLPGSKSTRADLAWLRDNGWDAAITAHLHAGGKLIGICGGLQMLGNVVHDPQGIEGAPGSSTGFGVLALETTLAADKQLRNVHGRLRLAGRDVPVRGYEIHCGVSTGVALAQGVIALDDGRMDGALSADGKVFATYMHGVFDAPEALAALLAWAGVEDAAPLDMHALREDAIERLADAVDTHLDTDCLWRLVGPGGEPPAPAAVHIHGATKPTSVGAPDVRLARPPVSPTSNVFIGQRMSHHGPHTLILGGARSGKSAHAEALALAHGGEVTYIATSTPVDAEMHERIRHHRERRPAHWSLVEEPLHLAKALQAQASPDRVLLVDCLTLWLSNLLHLDDGAHLRHECEALLESVAGLPGQLLLVSNEVGQGIVPMGALSRRFVDEAGRLHQHLAARLPRVHLVTAGLVQTLKHPE